MPKKKMKARSIKKQSVAPKVRKGELSTVGLNIVNGMVYEEMRQELRYPQAVCTFKEMSYDPTISAANNAIKSMIRRLDWKVGFTDTDDLSPKQEQMKTFIEECMNDMDTPWADFINEALSILTYGYSIHEKVYKHRNGVNGKHKSRYEDGKLGWAKLPIRSQDTIYRWIYDSRGQRITHVEQDLSVVTSYYGSSGGKLGFPETKIEIPYNKVLHFRNDVQRGNPEGNSPLKSVYIPWKYKTKIEEYEAIGIARDMGGMPIVELPPEYMSETADAGKKAVYEYFQDVIRNIHANEQMGLIMPKFVDPDTKQDLFGFKLEGVSGGGKQYDTNKIIERYENKILMAYLADVLKLGQDASGSFALSDNKTNLLAVGIEAILKQILDIINRDLIPQTFLMNGEDVSQELPVITHGDLDNRELDQLGKFIQQTVTSGAMEVDEEFSEWTRKQIKAPMPNRERQVKGEMIGGGESQAGSGNGESGAGNSVQQSGNKVTNTN
jgi:hypothetical protein